MEIKLRMNQSSIVLLSLEQGAAVGQPTEVCISKEWLTPTKASALSLQSCFKLHSEI